MRGTRAVKNPAARGRDVIAPAVGGDQTDASSAVRQLPGRLNLRGGLLARAIPGGRAVQGLILCGLLPMVVAVLAATLLFALVFALVLDQHSPARVGLLRASLWKDAAGTLAAGNRQLALPLVARVAAKSEIIPGEWTRILLLKARSVLELVPPSLNPVAERICSR